ncbi:MAG: TetR/AcrR family transcriptional regulator [Oligosphaeraceae bacterium]|nr:TetR/AcrR family transcriptional regulator [Oligosphaeraceae bacterium]
MAAAIRLFARDGFQGTSIDDLAKGAKVNRQRIYAYFGNKKKLFETAMLEVFAGANAEDDRLLELNEKDLPELTLILLRHYLDVHRKHPTLHRMIGWGNLQLRETPQWLKDIKKKSFIHLRQLYRTGQKRGVFSEQVSFDVYIFTLLAVTYFHTANRITATQTISPELFTNEGINQLVEQSAAMIMQKGN